MKKIIAITVLILAGITANLYGQSLVIGVKGAVNSTWLFNKYVSDAPASEQYYIPSFGGSYGVSTAIFFNEKIGLEVGLYYGSHKQKYAGDGSVMDSLLEYTSETSYKKVDIPLLFKVRSVGGAYFEIGPVYSMISNPTYDKVYEEDFFQLIYEITDGRDKDVSDELSKSMLEVMIGFGVNIELFSRLTLTTALRFSGSITDISGVDGTGMDLEDYAEYASTHSGTAGFLLGLTWTIGGKKKVKSKGMVMNYENETTPHPY